MTMLADKTVLVTGGGSGIGREASLVAAREGAALIVTDVNAAAAGETAREILQAGGSAVAIPLDIADEASVAGLFQLLEDAGRRIDCAFNNAGINSAAAGANVKLADVGAEAWRRIMTVNLTGTFLTLRAELRHMRAAGGGSIVNTASIAGLFGMANAGAYSVSKHGIVGLTKAAARDHAADAIRVNAICPGFVDTAFLKNALAQAGPQLVASVPLGRVGQPADIAELVIMSDRAAYVTGAAYVVDGGQTV